MTNDEFIQNVYKHPRRTKAKTRELIEDIVFSGSQPSLDDMAAIYRYFMPAQPTRLRKNCTAFEWVAAAARATETRAYLQWVYADGKRIVATDGHRLHMILDDREPGYYCPVSEALVHEPDWQQYPPIDRVIPTLPSSDYELVEDPKTTVVAGSAKESKVYVQIEGTESYVQERYWAEALRLAETQYVYTPENPAQTVLITYPEVGAKAVIMPVRV